MTSTMRVVSFPEQCPYCGSDVAATQKVHLPAPADLRDAPGEISQFNFPDTDSPPTILYERLEPCGHRFRAVDMARARGGSYDAAELAARVDNPMSAGRSGDIASSDEDE